MSNHFKFTKTTLQGLPVPSQGKRSTYYDTETPKLAIRVTTTGSKTFYVVKRVGSEMVWLKLGIFPDMTVEQARSAALTALSAFANNENPAEVRRARKKEPTFAELFKEYGERHGVKKRSWATDQCNYGKHLQSLAPLKVTTIKREAISRLMSDLEKAGLAGATQNNIRALVSSIYGRAIEWGYATANPVIGVKTRPKVKRDRFLQSDELPRFFAAVAEESNDTIRDYLLLALLTGARRANVLAMKWSGVNLPEGLWRIPRTKNGDPQNVTLSPEAITILQARKDAADEDAIYVFPGTGKSGHLVEPKKGWQRIFDRDELNQLRTPIAAAGGMLEAIEGETLSVALDRARKTAKKLNIKMEGIRIDDLRIHDLRRTLGSWQAKQGASLAIIGKSLNHKSQQTTAIYARLDLDPVRASVNTATAAMMEAGGVKKPADVVPLKRTTK